MARQKPLPYYRWYVQDYRASRNVRALSWQQRGLYRELLDECWVEGSIPDDESALADICGVPVAVMRKAWPALSRLFVAADAPGQLVSRRLEIERSVEDAERVKKALAGKKGGLAKASNAKHTPSTAKQTETAAKHRLASSSEQLEQSKSSSAATDAPSAASALGAPASGAEGGESAVVDWRDALRGLDDRPVGARGGGLRRIGSV